MNMRKLLGDSGNGRRPVFMLAFFADRKRAPAGKGRKRQANKERATGSTREAAEVHGHLPFKVSWSAPNGWSGEGGRGDDKGG